MPSPVYTFAPNGVIRASEFNTNFLLLEQCLGLAGGTLTGTINTQDVLPATTATYVLGSISKAYAAVVANAIKLTDSNSSHLLSIVTSSNLTNNRTLTFVPGDSNRTVTIAADCTIGGVAPVDLGGTGLSDTPTNGDLLIGNGTGFSLAQLTAGSNITITPGAGTIQIAAASAADTTPIGVVSMWLGTAVPTGDYEFLIGQDISRTTYATLWALMGSPNTGNGTTTFTLPDMRQRFPLGKAAAGTGSTLLGTGGTIDHTHTAASGGAHTHAFTDTTSSDGAHTHDVAGDTGAGSPHNHIVDADAGTTHPGGGGGDYVISINSVSEESDHTHGAGTLAAASDGAHTHEVSGTTSSDGAHTHSTDAANPPFIAVNFIVRAK